MLPLYRFDDKAFPGAVSSASAHPGLLFEKFVDGWGPDWSIPDNAKKDFYLKAAKPPASDELGKGLAAALLRQRQLAEALGEIEPIDVATDWRFVSGLGTGHPFEAGFIWHRTLGVPYLPGSSVKGMARAWAERWGGSADQQETTRLFGPRGESALEEADTGALIVFDALPLTVPKLEVDIMNPHFGPYYDDRTKPPADYYSPIPVFFLTVAPGQWFRFSLVPRPGAYVGDKAGSKVSDLQQGRELLKNALEMLGAGGKTAVGYGRFVPPAEEASSNKLRDSGGPTAATSHAKSAPPTAVPAKDEITLFREWFDRENFAQGQKKGQQDEIRKRVEKLTDPRQGSEYVRAKLKKKAAAPSVWAWLQQQNSRGDEEQ